LLFVIIDTEFILVNSVSGLTCYTVSILPFQMAAPSSSRKNTAMDFFLNVNKRSLFREGSPYATHTATADE
jgi:hypothetical protein